jgi:hypothetical protein
MLGAMLSKEEVDEFMKEADVVRQYFTLILKEYCRVRIIHLYNVL